MRLKHSIHTAVSGLKVNRSRTILTILGIVIGITAIMLVVSLGKGAQDLILGQLQGMGSRTIVVIPGREPSGPSDVSGTFLDSLKERDLLGIHNKSNVPYAAHIMPIVFGPARGAFRDETYQTTILGAGSTEEDDVMSSIFDIHVERGNFFNSADVKTKAAVAVIGSKVKDELFYNTDPLGEKFKLNNKVFRVVGILPSKGQVSFFNFDEMVIVPYTTAQQYVLGKKSFDRIVIAADEEIHIQDTVDDLTAFLRASHDISDPDKDDFFIETQADIAERLKVVTSALTAFLVAVAAISLFVGGVGIMNIMLVSVTERTKEIGLRKAIGATEKDIMKQFLLESVMLTGAGGIVGVFLGAILSFFVAFILSHFLNLDWNFAFPYLGALMGISVSVAIGLIFGIYPARHAARMNPIDALRYE